MNSKKQRNKSWQVVRIFIFINILFLFLAVLNYPFSKEQASMDVPTETLALQDKIDELFSLQTHAQSYFVFSDTGANTFNKELLIELREKSGNLRSSEFGNTFFLPVTNYPLPGFEYNGFFTLADLINDFLVLQGKSLEQATDKDLQDTLSTIIESENGEYIKLLLSTQSEKINGTWDVPAFAFFVQGDNEKLGGGIFRRVIGANDALLQKEAFNEEVQEALTIENPDYELFAIGGALNTESEREGFSNAVMIRNVGLVVALALLVGLILHSLKAFIIALGGLSTLAVWIMFFPIITFGFIKPSVMTQMILPLAFVSLGSDYFVFVVFKYLQYKEQGLSPVQALTDSYRSIKTAFFLAISTTTIAFGTNYISNVEALRSFALVAVFSTFSSLFILGAVCPQLFYLWDTEKKSNSKMFKMDFSFITSFIMRHKIFTSSILCGVTIFFGFNILKIESNIDPKNFLSSESDFVRSLDKREVHWGEIRGEEAYIYITGDLDSVRAQEDLTKVLNKLGENPYLAHIPNTNNILLPLGGPFFVNNKSGQDHMLAIVEILGTRDLKTVQKARDSILGDLTLLDERIYEYGLTGSPLTREVSLSSVSTSATKGFFVTAVIIYLLLVVFYRSLLYPIITILPMLFVIIWTYGFMGLAGYGLNFITATIASVSLGVGIDYAVHMVESFRHERKKIKDSSKTLIYVTKHTMPASFTTAISNIAGFVVLATTPMPLFATYGVLGMIMIGLSFIISLVVLSVCLPFIKK
ncbi:MAG: hypothetical protein RJA61_136 [Candidatus Parcubacteria bacterium]|jgi:predicted RND superfamily exporter protein